MLHRKNWTIAAGDSAASYNNVRMKWRKLTEDISSISIRQMTNKALWNWLNSGFKLLWNSLMRTRLVLHFNWFDFLVDSEYLFIVACRGEWNWALRLFGFKILDVMYGSKKWYSSTQLTNAFKPIRVNKIL